MQWSQAFKLGAVGWEERILPLYYAAHTDKNYILKKRPSITTISHIALLYLIQMALLGYSHHLMPQRDSNPCR